MQMTSFKLNPRLLYCYPGFDLVGRDFGGWVRGVENGKIFKSRERREKKM